MSCVYLSSEDILVVAGHACGDKQTAVRDIGLLESAAHRPSAAMLSEEAYPDLIDKAAALLQSLANSRLRPLRGDNKRAAWLSCVTFLAMNGVDLRPDIDAAERLVIDAATGETDEIEAISQGLRDLVVDAV